MQRIERSSLENKRLRSSRNGAASYGHDMRFLRLSGVLTT